MIINVPFLSQAKIVTMPNTGLKSPIYLHKVRWTHTHTDMEDREDQEPGRRVPLTMV